MINFTVIILTLNEEINIERCLLALPKEVQRIIVDSGSVDKTLEIAERHGVSVLSRAFDSFGSQRNWAMSQPLVSNDWILFLDADEEVSPSFIEEICSVIRADNSSLAGAYCCWKMILRNRWLRRADHFPKWQMRLVHRKRMSFIDYGHGQKEGELSGETCYIKEPYLHHAFSKGWTDWLARHNKYSDKEASERLKDQGGKWIDALTTEPANRNRLLKPLVTALPGWPFFRFLYSYVFKGGIFEGKEGFDYCFLMAIYEYFILLKMKDSNLK